MDELKRLINGLNNIETVMSGTKEAAEKRCQELIRRHEVVSGSMTDAQKQAVIDSEFTDEEAQACFDSVWRDSLK